MSSLPLKLTPTEAATILKANLNNIDHASKRILQKVVDKRTLSDDEVGTLEGIIANDRVMGRGRREAREENESLMPEGTLALATTRISEQKQEALDRQKVVAEWRRQHPPVPIREIAKRLGVHTDTVQTDIKAIRAQNQRILSAELSVQILGETVSQYDVLHGKCMVLADLFTSPMAKAALLRTAISALDSKAKLMAETGIIHRVPERQEILVAHANAGTVKSRVAALMKAQRQRKSDVLELEPAPLVDADLAEETSQDDGQD